jgi:hypothetical protein
MGLASAERVQVSEIQGMLESANAFKQKLLEENRQSSLRILELEAELKYACLRVPPHVALLLCCSLNRSTR